MAQVNVTINGRQYRMACEDGQELAALQDARGAAAERTQATQAALIAAFTSAAERIEGMAKKLNTSAGAGHEPPAG